MCEEPIVEQENDEEIQEIENKIKEAADSIPMRPFEEVWEEIKERLK